MKTQRRILLVVGAALLAFAGLVVLAEFLLGGLVGSLVVPVVVVAAIAGYLGLIRPWQHRWGATADEVARLMPGDGILGPGASSTTRSITIDAPACQVWPWLAQIGYGRAGWYSYDWLDNDGQRSAEHIQPEWQHLRSGDRILMMPGAGFDVAEVEAGHYFTAQAPDQTMSWCLAVEPRDDRSCRVISRWRADWHINPGQRRLDRAVRPRHLHHGAAHAARHQSTRRAHGPARPCPASLNARSLVRRGQHGWPDGAVSSACIAA